MEHSKFIVFLRLQRSKHGPMYRGKNYIEMILGETKIISSQREVRVMDGKITVNFEILGQILVRVIGSRFSTATRIYMEEN